MFACVQVVGFIVLISGTSMFNGIIKGPGERKKRRKPDQALPHLAGDISEPLLPSDLGQVKEDGKGAGGAGGFPMKRLVQSTMARSFRLGRSLFGTTPGGSRASSVANTPVQTPRYSNLNPSGNSSASMVFNGTHHSQRIEELPSSYESNVNLYNTNDNSISEENPAGLTSHIRNESNGEMEEPFE